MEVLEQLVTQIGILAISTDARQTPKVRVFEIVLESESEEAVQKPVLKKLQEKKLQVQDTPPRSEADLAMQLVEEIDLLLSAQDPALDYDESQEHSLIDETRSSIVVMPPDSDKVYRIVRDTIKRTEGDEKMDQPSFKEEPEMKSRDDNKSSTGKLAMQLVSEIDILLGHQNPDNSDNESQEHSIFDETRSSIVVMPPGRDKVYHIVRDTVKKPVGENEMNRSSRNSMEFLQHLQRDEISNDYEMTNRRSGARRN